ncbi:MAG: ribosome biogenesis GTP-binding protein YihA/YsxC [Pseudomonadota bacterium]
MNGEGAAAAYTTTPSIFDAVGPMVSLRSAHFMTSANDLSGCPPDAGVEVAFSGRSNAGKSSALNKIVDQRGLARTSKTPGRTQLINFFAVTESQRLVDLPGYGFAKVPPRIKAHWQRLLAEYFEQRQSLAGLVVIMDVRRPLMPFDVQMLQYGGAAGLPMHAVLTKADKLSRGAAQGALQKVRSQLDDRISAQVFSALKGTGLDELRATVTAWLTPVAPEQASESDAG